MISVSSHPGLVMMIFSAVILIMPESLGSVRKVLQVAAPVCAVTLSFMLVPDMSLVWHFIPGFDLQLIQVDNLSKMFAIVFSLAALIASVYSLNTAGRYEAAAMALYPASALGVTLAGDWISFTIFWELLAVAAWLIVVSKRTEDSSRAGFRYLMMHMFGGNMLLAGVITLLTQNGGDIALCNLTGESGAAYCMILIGVCVNAAVFPLHTWVPDAYPEASFGGTVYLASFTTKVGVYALIRIFAGTRILLTFGIIMALYGACMALIENNLRKLLSYHIVSQVGYMVASLAVATAFGMDGAAAHAFNHILYKGTLMMCAGSVVYATGRTKITELGCLYRKMPFTSVCFLIASLAISGFPFLNGFASKALIMEAMEEAGVLPTLCLTVASIGTFMSIALKINYFVFFGKGAGHTESAGSVTRGMTAESSHLCTKSDIGMVAEAPLQSTQASDADDLNALPINMKIGMAMGAAACVITGVFPGLVYNLTPNMSDGNPFTFHHIFEYIFLFIGAGVTFYMYRSKMAPHDMLTLDVDWVWRKPVNATLNCISAAVAWFFNSCYSVACSLVATGNRYLHQPGLIFTKLGIPQKSIDMLEDDDVLMRPAGRLVSINILLGFGIALLILLIIRLGA